MLSQQPVQMDSLLELGQPKKTDRVAPNPAAITLITYNIRWRTGTELRQIADWIEQKSDHPVIIALQEVDRTKKRTSNVNNARVLADELGLYYAWAAPPLPKSEKSGEEETGVELLSSFPLRDVTRLVLPHTGPGGRSRVALGASVTIGESLVRVYSVHSETRIPVSQKMDQLQAVIDDLAKFPKAGRAIVMGDFNTWEVPAVESTRKLFSTAGFTTPFADEGTTFYRNMMLFDVKLKLDWIWLRGLTVQSSGIDRAIGVSDHFPLWLIVTLAK